MSTFNISRILISLPFFLIGAAFLGGAVWLGIDRLVEGLAWKAGDGLVVVWLAVQTVFGGAFLQFGKDALYKGHSEKSRPLVGPVFYYLLGVLFLVPGVWSFIAGSNKALMVSVVGVGFMVYGLRLSRRVKHQAMTSQFSGATTVVVEDGIGR